MKIKITDDMFNGLLFISIIICMALEGALLIKIING